LEEHGIEAPPIPDIQASHADTQNIQADPPSSRDTYTLAGILDQEADPQARTRRTGLKVFRPDSIGDNYLGVSAANEWPTPLNGTSLALFGMELDLTEFVPQDLDHNLLTSYETIQKYALRTPALDAPPLPPYHQTRALCEWYLKFLNPWAPILHKPTLMAMVTRSPLCAF